MFVCKTQLADNTRKGFATEFAGGPARSSGGGMRIRISGLEDHSKSRGENPLKVMVYTGRVQEGAEGRGIKGASVPHRRSGSILWVRFKGTITSTWVSEFVKNVARLDIKWPPC